MLAQFTGAKIQFEDPKTEPTANLLIFSHGEVNLDEKRVYHWPEFACTRHRNNFL